MPASKTPRRTTDSVPRDTTATRRARTALREASPAPSPKMITVNQFCAELDISRSTFYEWRAKGRAPKCKKLPNGELRILLEEYDRWLDDLGDAA
jgi:predicted DNA-binding transcriptional regulator AlpA